MTFVFWQNIISPHQSSFLRALAANGHKVTVVATEAITPDRLALGWKVPDTGKCEVILAPSSEEIRQIIGGGGRRAGSSEQDAIHILAGARWTLLGEQATRLCIAQNRRMGVLSEAPDPRGVAGLGRRVKYAAERFTTGRHFDFVLAMGAMGVDWFRHCGYPASRLFPFAYVTERRAASGESQVASGDQKIDSARSQLFAPHSSLPESVTILYVGQLIRRKRADLLLHAFAQNLASRSRLPAACLVLLGDGPEETTLRQLADRLEISETVVWLGRKDSGEIPTYMAAADVLALPSGHDGWGAVVNEALMAGTPVICSSASGAAELLRESWRGEVFPAGSVSALAAALQRRIVAGRLAPQAREQIKVWSTTIGGEAVADYFLRIMRRVYEGGECQEAPWRE
jgi:glycosyltransferase involved in cell wall biosynthesis